MGFTRLAGILALLLASVVTAAILSAAREDDRFRAHQAAQRRLEAEIRDVALSVVELSASTHPEPERAAARARAGAADQLAAIVELAPTASREAEAARAELSRVADAAARVFRAEPGAPRADAMGAFAGRVEQLHAKVEALEDRIAREVRARYRLALAVVVAALTLGGALLATAWFVHRRQGERHAAARERSEAAALDALASRLREVRNGAAVPPLPPRPELLGPLGPELHAVVDALARERRAHERNRRRFALSQEIAEALDLADGEREVTDIVARAAAVAFATASFQLLLVDDAEGTLSPQLAGGARVCSPGEPLACPALRRGRVLSHLPGGGIARCRHLAGSDAVVTCAVVPARGRHAGIAQVVGEAAEGDTETLVALGFAAGSRLGVLRTLGEREAQAAIDPLTGLSNRRGLEVGLARLERAGEPYGVICADIDHFKRLNDRHGHDAGDQCLRTFARVLRETCRAGDLPVRQGGEEFAVILPGTTVEGARVIGERIRQALAEATQATRVPFTASFGIAGRPELAATAEEALACADAALYRAKERGRDRVEVHEGLATKAPVSLAVAVPPAERGGAPS